MTVTKPIDKIDFRAITPKDKSLYESYLARTRGRGCEFSFCNLYLWGRQSFAVAADHILLFSQFSRRTVYPYPVGDGDKREALELIIADAKARGIPCRITGLNAEARQTVEELFPDKFRFHSDEGSFDYVYSIDDLAELRGKKYQGKRNHINRFAEAHPDFCTEVICDKNIVAVRKMAEEWYEARLRENPNADFHMERAALERALRDLDAIGMEGLVLLDGDEVLAFTIASRMSEDAFDVHFEKARPDVQGAYAAVNQELARYIREKYPAVRYLDREEDMGLEGLRRAKQSYHPCRMVEKCWACLLEDGYDY